MMELDLKGKYGLNIAFYMETYAQLNLNEEDSYEFEFNNYNFKLTNLKKNKAYSIIIKPINDRKHAELILNKFKIASMLFVLKHNFAAIEIDEEIKDANVHDEPINFQGSPISADIDLDRTMMFPLNSNLVQVTSGYLSLINPLDIKKLEDTIKKTDELDINHIIDDEKLILALEFYLKISQYHFKAQFLDLVTILEILKPNYSISNKSIDNFEIIKDYIKKFRNEHTERDSEEYGDLDRCINSISNLNEKSISKAINLYVVENNAYFGDYKDIDRMLKNVYTIRSKLLHSGKISNEKDFYDTYIFLKNFIKELLLNKINDYKNCSYEENVSDGVK